MCKQVILDIEQAKIIVIMRGVAREKLIPTVQAMYEGGIRLVECTYDASGKTSDEEIAAMVALVSGAKNYVNAPAIIDDETATAILTELFGVGSAEATSSL